MHKIIIVTGLLCASLCAQTTISEPASAVSTCGSMDCIADPSKVGPPGAKVRTYPYPSWDLDDAAPGQTLSKPAEPHKQYGNSETYHLQQCKEQSANDLDETEFQRFISRSTGNHLPIYGGSSFWKAPSTLVEQDHIPLPADYVLATGDHLLIHVWGHIDFNARVIVDRNGEIYLPKVGMINVAGVRYDQIHEHLKDAISRLFRNFELSVSLGQMRTIQVFVLGQARCPGRYTVSSLATLANVLFFAGGPAANGSMRRIQLRRQERIVTEFDMYDLLHKGDRSRDAVLQSGDVIYVSPVGSLVAVWGSVNQPAIYELRGSATVRDQIEAAGGLSATANGGRAVLERINSDFSRKVEEFVLDAEGQSRTLHEGDLLHIFPISPQFENAVALRGNVAHPGRYPWHMGMKVSDLIPSRDAIITDEFWVQQNVLGQVRNGWIDGPDRNHRNIDTKPDTSTADTQNQRNDVVRSGQGVLFDSQQANDMSAIPDTPLPRNSAEINWDYAVIQHLNKADLSSRLLPFNLGHVLSDVHSPDNLQLEPGDIVTIFSQQDIQVPVEKRTKFVWIEGEVQAAGVYRVEPGETLREILVRAGGVTPQAYLFASDFRRQSTRVEQEQKLDRMLDAMDKELRAKAAALASNSSADERFASKEELEAERSVIEKLRQTRPTGRIILDLKPSDTQATAIPQLPLEDGDRITIPAKPATIAVAGEVYNQNAFLFRPGKSVNDYLQQSGGATRDADPARMFVIRADGSVVSKQMQRSVWAGSFESMKPMPGDTIVIPERIRTGGWLRGVRDWSQVFAQFALGAAAIRVISP